jgi:hypothetical protein
VILPASYSNGFAPRDGQPLYPGLWRGCVGAWAPCLGPTGLTLRDWSGFGNHGVLTNGPAWVPSQGRYAISFDGTDDYINFGTRPNVYELSRFSCSFWIYKTSNSAGWVLNRYNTSAAGGVVGDYFGVGQGTSIPTASSSFTGGGVNDYVVFESPDIIALNKWHHVAMSVDLATRANTTITVNGVYQAVTITTNGVPPSVFKAATSTVWTSSRITGSGGGQNYSAFIADDVMLYRYFIPQNMHRLLASRPGIAYELAPRRRSSSAVVITSGFSALRPSILRGSR